MRWTALLLALGTVAAQAQTYPAKPVRMIVPYPAGSTPDIVGRTLAERLQKEFGQPFLVENRKRQPDRPRMGTRCWWP